MGKDLNGKELGTGISQRPDGIYMARAQCCGKPICIYGRNYQKLKKELEEKEAAEAKEREKHLQQALLEIKKRYGKNAVLKGMNLEEGATTIERNSQIGGHKA